MVELQQRRHGGALAVAGLAPTIKEPSPSKLKYEAP